MTSTTRHRLFAILLVVGLLPAQAPAPPKPPLPTPPAKSSVTPTSDPAEIAAARALLDRFAHRSLDIRVLVADYVQRRTTELSKEPLVSRGEFLYVRDPACVMFRARTPRVSIVRLAGSTYEVYRPQKLQLERFHLDGPELAQGLFAAVGGDATRLAKEFDVVRCVADPASTERTQVRLVPKVAAVRERLGELVVTLWNQDAALFAVAYRDHSGDLVEIELQAVRENPKDAPSASLEVPKDAKVLEHTASSSH